MGKEKISSNKDFESEYIGSVHGETLKRLFVDEESSETKKNHKKHSKLLHRKK